MIAIGLTGGIGSGKSTVADRLGARGASVVDTDEISRALTASGGSAVAALARALGENFVDPSGALDRAAVRRLVFEDPAARAKLEAVLHPAIRKASDTAIAAARGPYVLIVVPLLFETRGFLERVSRVLVVDCPEGLQVRRVAARSALAADEVRAIMLAQWPRWRRLQMADDVVWNGGEAAALDAQCERLDVFYREMASRAL